MSAVDGTEDIHEDKNRNKVMASDLLALLSATRAIPLTSPDLVADLIRSATGNPRELIKVINPEDSSKLSSLTSLVSQVENQGGDVSTVCAVLLLRSESSNDLLLRRRIRDIVCRIGKDWTALFNALALELVRSDPFAETRNIREKWSTLTQTSDLASYVATEQDLFEQLQSYTQFAGLTPPTDADRVERFLEGLNKSTKDHLEDMLRSRSIRTEQLTYVTMLSIIGEVATQLSIDYRWNSRSNNEKKKNITTTSTSVAKCEGCGRKGHSLDLCWVLNPELKPALKSPPRQEAKPPSQPPAKQPTIVCEHCKKQGHEAKGCWTLNPHLRPNAPQVTPESPPAELVPKAAPKAPTYTKPVTRSDTKKTFAIIPSVNEHSSNNSDELIVKAYGSDIPVSMFIDTLSSYSICSTKTAERLGTSVNTMRNPISVKTFDGSSVLTGEATIPLSFRVDSGTHKEFLLRVFTVDRELNLKLKPNGDYEDSLILGLHSLQRMGAILDLVNSNVRFAELDNISLPLLNRNDIPIEGITESDEQFPSLDENPEAFEQHLRGMSDLELDEFIKCRLSKWTPLMAECRLKPNCPPQHHRGYPVPPTEVDNMKNMIAQLVAEGVLVPTVPTPESYISPAFLRPKSDGRRRLVVNVKALNEAQIIEDLDLPCSLELLKHVSQRAKAFAVVDVSDAFHTVEYRNDISRKLHTIAVMGRHFEYTRCVQGDANSPRFWMKHLEGLLQKGIGVNFRKWCIPYVDDIIVFAEDEETCQFRLNYLQKLLTFSGKKISHCQAPNSEVEICGMIFSEKGWKMSEDSVQTLRQLMDTPPTTLKELRSGLGTINYMRNGYGGPSGGYLSDLTRNFYDELTRASASGKKNPQVSIDPAEWFQVIDYFQDRYCCFTDFDIAGKFILTADASDHHCGATLFFQANDQEVDGEETTDPNRYSGINEALQGCKLVDVFSRRFTTAERNWPIYERESYALYLALTRWSGILWKFPKEDILILTDSMVALSQWTNLAPPEKLQSQRRWLTWYEGLSFYNLTKVKFRYINGEENSLADMLSRIVPDEDIGPMLFQIQAIEESEALLYDVDHSELFSPYSKPIEPSIRTLMEADVAKPDTKVTSISGLLFHEDFSFDNTGIANQKRLTVYVPPGTATLIDSSTSLRQYLISLSHGSTHLGWKSTYATLRELFWWPEVKGDVKRFVKDCGDCIQLRKEASQPIEDVQVQRLPVANCFAHVYVDHFHGSENFSNNICLTIRDHFSGYVMFVAVDDETAQNAVNALLRWVGLFGTPRSITSDLGSGFDSAVWRGMCDALRINPSYTSVRNPRANRAERPHRLLRLLCNESTLSNASDWHGALALATLSWNNSRAAVTAPNMIVFGKLLIDPFLATVTTQLTNPDDNPEVSKIQELIEQIQNAHRRFLLDSAADPIALPPAPLQEGDYVRGEDGLIGLVKKVDNWSAKVEWPSGNLAWHRYFSLRKVTEQAAKSALSGPVTDYVVVRHEEGNFAAKVLERSEDRLKILWLDNHGGASYTPLAGVDPEWIPQEDVICHVQLTNQDRFTEVSRRRLEELGIL